MMEASMITGASVGLRCGGGGGCCVKSLRGRGASGQRREFLRAEWRRLVMLNYEVDRKVLAARVPHGTELDEWQGKVLVSMVGFLFLQVKVMGVPIPFHRNFEEVNLRFYVRKKCADGWRRGVVFVREIVPRTAISLVANTVYQEPYVTMPMCHQIAEDDRRVEYGWRSPRRRGAVLSSARAGQENRLWVETSGKYRDLRAGEEAEFITEHYWGYTKHRNGDTWEYEVEHPRWRVADATGYGFECDVAGIYGDAFVESLTGRPESALLAEGSPIVVYRGTKMSR